MDENTGGTPNPLNPNPGIGQNSAPTSGNRTVSPASQTRRPVRPTTAATSPTAIPSPRPVRRPITTGAASTTKVATGPTTTAGPELEQIISQVEPEPMDRPMEKAPEKTEEKPKKKKKTGLIIGALVCVFLAVGCGVTAALLLMNGGDPVARAMNKLVNGELPPNIAIDGKIDIEPSDSNSEIAKLQLALNTEASTTSTLNSTTATMSVSTKSYGDHSLELDEIYAANGDLYFKVDGLADFISGLSNPTTQTSEQSYENCIENEDGTTNCDTETLVEDCDGEECLEVTDDIDDIVDIDKEEEIIEYDESLFAPFMGVVDVLDGEWMRVSLDEIKAMSEGGDEENQLSCVVDLAEKTKNSSNSLAEYYTKNPFISSTTENLTVQSKQNPIYQITVDSEKFTNYVNDIKNSDFMNSLTTCLGEQNDVVNPNNLVETVEKLPPIYVEIDGNDNFTRLYFTANTEDNEATITADFDFTYPENINVSEPTEYKNLFETIQQMIMENYDV